MNSKTTGTRSLLVFLTLAFAFAMGACDEETDTVHPSLTQIELSGFWEGTTPGTRLELSLRHDRATDEVRGFGAMVPTGSGASQAFRVDGFVDDDRDIVTLLLEVSSPAISGESEVTLVHYRARLIGPDRLQGQLNGGIFTETALTLDRED